MSPSAVIALLAAVSGGASAAVIAGWFQRPKTRAEADKLIAESGQVLDARWRDWASRLEAQVAALQEQCGRMELELARERWVSRLTLVWALSLRDEVVRLGGTVPLPPPEVSAYLDADTVIRPHDRKDGL